jgi:hypothetical protein
MILIAKGPPVKTCLFATNFPGVHLRFWAACLYVAGAWRHGRVDYETHRYNDHRETDIGRLHVP